MRVYQDAKFRNMLTIRTLEVSGLASALYALRLPFKMPHRSNINAWQEMKDNQYTSRQEIILNDDDKKLLVTLAKRGDEHAKVIRGINVYAEISAPLSCWSEMDTYRIGSERLSSESTMHTIGRDGLSLFDLFIGEHPNVSDELKARLEQHHENTISLVNELSSLYKESKDFDYVLCIKEVLPTSFVQKRVQEFSYQTIRRIVKQREGHRLPGWRDFIDWARTLPLANELIFFDYADE